MTGLVFLIFATTGFLFLAGITTHHNYQLSRNLWVILSGDVYFYRPGSGVVFYIPPYVLIAAIGLSGLLLGAAWKAHRATAGAANRGFPLDVSTDH
jgi:hypothetical protein